MVKTNDPKYDFDPESGSIIMVDENEWSRFQSARRKASEFEKMKLMIIQLTDRVKELEKKIDG